MSDLSLAYGLRTHPTDVPAVWGARLIWPADLVQDRQDVKGEATAVKELCDWLNGGALQRALDAARHGAGSDFYVNEDRAIVLYEDDRGIVKGNPQGSHGYLYVAAWLKGDESC